MDITNEQSIKDAFETLTKKYYNSPIKFVSEIFKVKPTEQQELVLNSLAHDKKVSVRAGHGVGKSTVASWAVYWFLLTRPYPKIICTAPTFHQLYDVLWSELAKWRRHSELISEFFEWSQRRIEAKWAPKEWFAAARTADKAEGLQGRHADHLLLIVDEASGIDDEIFQASEGMLTGKNAYVLMLSNPTRNSGYFYDSHNKDKKVWKCHTLPCHGSPLVSNKYMEDMKYKWGIDSNVYKIRVLGDFPDSEEDALIPRNWIIDAIGRDILPAADDPILFGVDVARGGGDSSVVLIRQGNKIKEIEKYNVSDTMQLVGWVMQLAEKHKPTATFVDVIGLGAGVFDRLRELGMKGVYPVNVSEKATLPNKYFRMRDELWFKTRELFEQRLISLPDDEELVDELSSIRVLPPDSVGRFKVESKKQMKTRGDKSPNKADALCLTNYFGRAANTIMAKVKIKPVAYRDIGII